MEWTRKQCYRKYKDWDAQTLLDLQAQAATSPYQMYYHIHPFSGLLNDSSGFSYYNGEYHLFCQSYPFGPVHEVKSWIHFASPDLVHWHYLGPAIDPDSDLDNAGAYSGLAMEHNGKLLLMYTGNHHDKDWTGIPYQVIAEIDENNHITKPDKAAILPPDHVSEHFHDPQLFKHSGRYYVLLDARDTKTKSGHIDIYESDDPEAWHENGYLDLDRDEMGYMTKCPNLVFVDNYPVLISYPQGLDKSIADYQNTYPNMYWIGKDINLNRAQFTPPQDHPVNLGDGFGVYATQAFNTPDGNAYAISWVGLPDCTYPADKENWTSCYSQVKYLEIRDGVLYQHPVDAIKDLRHNEKQLDDEKIISQKASKQYELKLHLAVGQAGKLHLASNEDLSASLVVDFNTARDAKLTIDHASSGPAANPNYGATRTIEFNANRDLSLDIFVDGSLCEIFINDGRHVVTLRFFAPNSDQKIALDKDAKYTGRL